MNRRGFLAMLTGAALDPERLLWMPGRKLISIPRPCLTYNELPAIGEMVRDMFRDTMDWALQNPDDVVLWMNEFRTPLPSPIRITL